MKNNERRGFILYFNFAKQFRMLNPEEQGELIMAIFDYAERGRIDVTLSPRVDFAFSFIADVLDLDRAEYEAKCEKRRKNGRWGDRSPKSTPEDMALWDEKSERFSEKPKKPDIDTDTDTDTNTNTDTDTDTNTDTDTDTDTDTGTDTNTDTATGTGADTEAEPSSSACAERKSPYGVFHTPAPPLQQAKKNSSCFSDSISNVGLSTREWEILINRGVPKEYVEKRIERAVSIATRQRKDVTAILLGWWEEDREARPSEHTASMRMTPMGILCEEDAKQLEEAIEMSMKWDGR